MMSLRHYVIRNGFWNGLWIAVRAQKPFSFFWILLTNHATWWL
jgi:hypothetical protein